MYPNLNAELARKKMSRAKLAAELQITSTTMSLKLNGRAELTLAECEKIREIVNNKCTLDYLFCTTQKEKGVRSNDNQRLS